MRIKATSHLVTLNHFNTDLGILKRQQALGTILAIILMIFLLGGFSGRFGGYGYGYGHGGVGVIGAILIIVVVLILMGRL